MAPTKQTARTSRPSTKRTIASDTRHTDPAHIAAPVASKNSKTPSSSLFDTIVTILVGPEHAKFGVHKALLCHHSSYFKAALTGRFGEAEEGTITLEAEDPEVFSRFNAWLYTGDFRKDEDDGALLLGPALDLCVFAAKRMVPRLRNAIVDRVIKAFSRDSRHQLSTADADVCVSAWESCGDSSLQTFLVDLLVVYFDLERAAREGRVAGLPVELMTLIAVRAQRAGKRVDHFDFYDLREYHCSRYHVHEELERECKALGDPDETDTEED